MEAGTLNCGACGALTPVGGRFCIQCGAAVLRSCGSCGAAVVPGARFCLQCGASVSAAAPAPAPTAAVTALGEEVGMPSLRVRAGVLTGNAAVDLGAEGEGMVLGDTVNTASRLQSIAAPGTVLVDDVTRRASEAAIAYEDAGTHEVKGREQPVRTWTALSVVAGAAGARRGAGLEAPFVGRESELQLVIDALEDSV